jgi:hypothetical protein
MDKAITKEYYKLFCVTFNKLRKSNFGWRDIVLLFLSLVVGAGVSYLWKGKDFMNEQIFSFIAFSMLPLGLFALGYVIRFVAQTPVEIYKSQIAKLEPYDWERVDISVKPFKILGLRGWGIEVKNNKGIALENVSIWYVGKREGQDEARLDERERLGYINFKAEKIQFESTVIEPTKSALFVVTAQETGMPVSFFRTHKKRYPTVLNFLDFAVDVEINAKTLPYTELPSWNKRLNIFPDGKVSIRHVT